MENMEKQWLNIDQKEISRTEVSRMKGVTVKVMVSPSDVPSAVRYYVDDEHHKLVVEFKYLSSGEKLVLDKSGSGAELVVGKNSRKIYKIAFDTKDVIDNHSGKVNLEMIVGAEKDIGESYDKKINHANKDVIDSIFRSKYIQSLGMA